MGSSGKIGERLADGIAAGGVPRDTLLNGTLVALGGVALPLLYVSPSQINAIVPYGLPINTALPMVVQRGTSLTVPVSIPIAPAQPAVFTTASSGVGQGHIYVSGTTLAGSGNPARPGDTVVIFCAGLGAVDQRVDAASPAPVANTLARATVTIGGKDASVAYSGLAPGFTGLYQINAVVPDGVTPGSEVPVIITIAGQVSPPVTIAVTR